MSFHRRQLLQVLSWSLCTISIRWSPSCKQRESRSKLTRKLIPTDASQACMTQNEIRSNGGSLHNQPLEWRSVRPDSQSPEIGVVA